MRSTSFVLITFVLATTACSEISVACPSDLRIQRAPADTTIRIGDSFVPKVELRGCAGRKVLQDTVTFASSDVAVVSVVSSTGRTMAQAVGAATVEITGARYGTLPGIRVTVIP